MGRRKKQEVATPTLIAELQALGLSVEDVLRAFDSVANTPDGEIVLRAIFELSRYDKGVMTYDANTSDLNVNATIYNLSKRDVWLKFRQYLTAEKRALIENKEN
ncbi:MAG TPA: hypothetical protein V6D22_13635 [Candidatus Obscuribacterales bacterium]